MEQAREQEEENGSDEAPEDVSLSQGREEALRTRRVAALEAKKAMATLKEQRKKREKLFTAQKIAKQEKNLVRFPAKDLQQVVKLKKSKVGEIHTEKVVSNSKVTKQKKRKAKKQPPNKQQFGLLQVVALESQGTRSVAAGHDVAVNFVQQQLYHSTRYKRVPILSLQAQRYTNKPAANFV